MVKSRFGVWTVKADWFRITPLSNHVVFYSGLRKVAWFEDIDCVVPQQGEVE